METPDEMEDLPVTESEVEPDVEVEEETTDTEDVEDVEDTEADGADENPDQYHRAEGFYTDGSAPDHAAFDKEE